MCFAQKLFAIWATDIWPIATILKHHLAVSSTHFDQQLFGRLTHYKIFNTLSDSEFHAFWSKTIWPTDVWPIARFLKLSVAMSSIHFDQKPLGQKTSYPASKEQKAMVLS
jgi:hypothetical protein